MTKVKIFRVTLSKTRWSSKSMTLCNPMSSVS